jgi:hypothetical protein
MLFFAPKHKKLRLFLPCGKICPWNPRGLRTNPGPSRNPSGRIYPRRWRAPGRRVVNGVARVVVHEVLHYFLPGRPHDPEGVFVDHVGGNLLARSSFAVSTETRDALAAILSADPATGSTR